MIDTEEKRRSASGLHFAAIPTVTPTVGKDAEWRIQAAGNYSGVVIGAAPSTGRIGIGDLFGNIFGNVFGDLEPPITGY